MVQAEGSIFDAHLHIIDPRFPLWSNQGFTPEPFTADEYRTAANELNIQGGAVVSGSFQGFDQIYLTDALRELGGNFVGVTQLPSDVSDSEIERLDQAGVRALRFNLYRGGSAGLEHLERLARRVHHLAGWHVELYLGADHLSEVAPRLKGLPQIVIDHLGMDDDPSGELLELVDQGAVVKATGLGRITIDEPAALMRQILAVNPAGLIFGTDLPSTRAKVPFRPSDIDLIRQAVGEKHSAAVFRENALSLYRLSDTGRTARTR